MAWLAAQQLRRRARAVVSRVAKFNGLPVTTELLAHLDKVCLATAVRQPPAAAATAARSDRTHTAVLMAVWYVLTDLLASSYRDEMDHCVIVH